MPRLTDQQRAEIRARYRRCESVSSIASLYGIGVGTVRNILTESGGVSFGGPVNDGIGQGNHYVIPLETREAIRRRYHAGESAQSLAAAFHLPQNTIVRVAGPREGFRTGRPPLLTLEQREEVRRRRKDGEAIGALAAAFKVSNNTIQRIIGRND